MAMAEPYLEPLFTRRRGHAVREYFNGTSVASYIAFAAAAALVFIALFAPFLAPHNPTLPAGKPLIPPGAHFWMGTDEIGRDIFSRVLMGVRSSCFGAVAVITAGLVVGSLVGLVSGAAGGIVDTALTRITDVFLALPGTILAVALVAALGPSYGHTLFGMSIVWWPLYARIVRAEVRRLRALPHLDAARLSGAGRLRLVLRHLLPGAVPAVIVTASLDVSALVLALAGLSFLGLGAPQPAPELGAMTAKGMNYIFEHWWVPIMPAIAVSVIAVVANFFGDALRDRIRDR